MMLFKRILTTADLSLSAGAAVGVPANARADSSHQEVREIDVIVQGVYKPSRIEVIQGQHVQLRFIRNES